MYFAPSNLYFENGEYKFLSSTFINKELFNRVSTRPTMASSANCVEVYDITGWYVPSCEEWKGLVMGAYSIRKYSDHVTSIVPYRIITDERTKNIWGLLLLPDDYTYAETQAELENEEKYNDMSRYKKNVNIFKYLSKGCVFLPSYNETGNNNCYLSSNSYSLNFTKNGSYGGYGVTPYDGFGGTTATEEAVRLIHEE